MKGLLTSSVARYCITLAVLWAVAAPAAWMFLNAQQVPQWLAVTFTVAVLVEASLYLLPGFFSQLPVEEGCGPRAAWGLPACLTVSAVVPYLIYALLAGVFSWSSLGLLAALAAVIAFWYVVLPRRSWADLLFLAFVAAVTLSNVFRQVIPTLNPRAPGEILGRLMWIRMGISTMLWMRRVAGTGFGFIPSAREWKIGVLYYAGFLPVAFLLNLYLGFARLRAWPPVYPLRTVALAVGVFFGMLWVVALSEEFFFRGLLQRWIGEWTGRPFLALALTSVVFGAAHVTFPPGFPNWKFVILATGAGFFYGRAAQVGGGIRAAMVTHALVNVTWRTFFM